MRPLNYPLTSTGATLASPRDSTTQSGHRVSVDDLPAMIYIADAGDVGNIHYHSPQIAALLGFDPDEWVNDPVFWQTRLHPDDQKTVRLSDERANATGAPFTIEYRLLARDGKVVWIRDSGILVRAADGRPRCWQGVTIDITTAKEAEARLADAENRFRTLVEQLPAAVFQVELEEPYATLYISPQVEQLLGYPASEWLETPDLWQRLLHPADREHVLAEAVRTTAMDEPFSMDYRMLAKDGRVVWIQDETVLIVDGNGDPRCWQGIWSDISEHKALEAQLTHQAHHDALTQLPNRTAFTELLAACLRQLSGCGDSLAVLFLDLDNFKLVNDSINHQAGDALLIEAAERVRFALRGDDTVARLGGDEFAVLLPGADEDEAIQVARRLITLLNQPFTVAEREVQVSCSIGIALGTSRDDRPGDLLRRADLAMYHAKAHGKNGYASFMPSLEADALDRLDLAQQLRHALEAGEFVVHYQPVIRLETGCIVGVEALVRWQHPTRGLVAPGEFIPIAEETGLIGALGASVLRESCRQIADWNRRLPDDRQLHASVNLSAHQLHNPELVELVRAVLAETALPPARLVLEITESVLIEDVDTTSDVLQELAALGIHIAIDDFGIGFSSLANLRHFPLQLLKIDQQFVAGLGVDVLDTIVVAGVADLAHNLGLRVIAEGIETSDQLEQLKELGCDFGQGYGIARPLPADELWQLLDGPR